MPFAPCAAFRAAVATPTIFVAMLPVRVQAGRTGCSRGSASFRHVVADGSPAAIFFAV